MSMQPPIQGPRLPPEPIKLLIDDRMKIKSSWGSRSVTIQTANNGPHTIKLKELVKLLEQKVETARSPGDIKRTREMLRTIKKMVGEKRNPITKFLDYVGVTNEYDAKFAELGKKIEAPLLREEHQKELADLKLSLMSKEGELPEALRLADDENSYNNLLNQGSQLTKANKELKVLKDSIQDIKAKINVKKEILAQSFPETIEIEKLANAYMLPPEYAEDAKTAAYSRYDELINIDDDESRLFAAEMALKEAVGHAVTPKEEVKLDFLKALNNIPIDFPIKKEKDQSLIEKKDVFINNLKQDSPLRVLLANEGLQKLAKEMDDVMDKNISMQDFAEVVGITYPERIRAILGTEDIDDASVALVLLQTNTSFPDALKNLDKYRNDHPDLLLDLAPHLTPMEMLDEVSDLRSQIDEINKQLNNSGVEDDVSELYKKQDALYLELGLFS